MTIFILIVRPHEALSVNNQLEK